MLFQLDHHGICEVEIVASRAEEHAIRAKGVGGAREVLDILFGGGEGSCCFPVEGDVAESFGEFGLDHGLAELLIVAQFVHLRARER